MYKLSLLTLLALFVAVTVFSQSSPHGDKLNMKCDVCHVSKNWTTIVIKKDSFNHNDTGFPLTGQHQTVSCKKCHSDLDFSTAKNKTECISCHADVHQLTLGRDCGRCHTPLTWKVENITRIHDQSRFPLHGSHAVTDCMQCHKSASLLRYDPIGTECIDCHSADYFATTNPSHVASKFPTDCNMCHNENNWQSATFNHNNTAFPLKGAHVGLECIQCHAKGYAGTPTTCVSCHLTNYNATTNPNHVTSKFSTDCITCHNVTAWSPATFNHNTATTFPLTGSHAGVLCISCHTNGYGAIPTTCVSCHLANYTATTNPSHSAAKFPTTCETCHTTTVWQPSTFNHTTSTSFPLKGAHVGVACQSCHTNGYSGGTPATCVGCHLNNYNTAANPNHVANNFSKDCQTCHNVTAWQPSTFNHTTTSFPLTGAHTAVACVSCHTNGYTGGTPTTCVGCHLTNFNATTNPNHVLAKFSTDCKTCHNVTAWSPATFNHTTATTFPLTGAHIGVACISCHAKGYAGIPTTCVSCHLTNYNATTNPNHVTSKFSTDCITCHNVSSWTSATFNHNTATTFPLTGAHIGVACVSCHPTGYTAIPTTCVSCHQTNYNATTNPSHSAAKFPTTCETCHTTTAWQPSTFNHTTSTTFPLTGAHVGVACVSCHTNGYTGGTPTTCVGCHLTNYNTATVPNHTTNNFSKDCQICHNNTAWQPSTFNHATTSFPLTGSHVGVACGSCHTNGYTGGTPITCVGCHLTNYNTATVPNHTTNNFSKDCQICHNNTAWQPSTFNHATTSFPLTGTHSAVACGSCHTNGYTGGTPTTCVSCHLTNYNTATVPNHTTNNFSKDCQICHNNTAWQPSTFNHATTSFPLTGAHSAVACGSCHTNGYTGGTPATCVGCHLTNFNATTNPNHVLAKFSTDCKTCHNVNTWSPSTFNHTTATSFPLAGAHIGVTCISCHAKGYAGIPTTCVSCHLTNYNATTNPNHATAKFPTTCETCHTVTAWTPSTFNHTTSTAFPLTGSHTGVACVSCHPTGYTAIPTTCVSCHLASYNATTNPNHVTAKFATTCETCHTTKAWVPSTFNHSTATTFPLTGAHTGVACVSCHPSGYAAIPTTCVSCHLTTYNATTNPNHVTSKFPTTCETCHSTTNWTSSTFNHSTSTTFPLTGAHIGLTCIQCHPTNYNAIPTTCVSCHLTNYNATTNPNHTGAKFATTCQTCHTTTNWTSATFKHNTVATIPLTGNHNLSCSTCHTTSTNYAIFSCRQTGCHANAHNASAGSTGCYSCHPTGRAG